MQLSKRVLGPILLLLTTVLSLGASPVSEAVSRLAEKVVEDRIYYGDHIGLGGGPPPQLQEYQSFRDQATEEELISLVDSPDPLLRCYAFRALVFRNKDRAFNLALTHIGDLSIVNVQYFDVGGAEKVADLYVQNFDRIILFSGSKSRHPIENVLSDAQRQELETALINTPGARLDARTRVLERLEPLEKYYERIRKIAVEDHDPGAILWLGKYRSAEDIPTIVDFLQTQDDQVSALRAVQLFPHEAFLPLLVKMFDREWSKRLYDYVLWRNLIVAMAKYEDDGVRERFRKIVDTEDTFRRQTLGADLYIAIKKSSRSYYDDLLSRIVLNESERQQAEYFLR